MPHLKILVNTVDKIKYNQIPTYYKKSESDFFVDSNQKLFIKRKTELLPLQAYKQAYKTKSMFFHTRWRSVEINNHKS